MAKADIFVSRQCKGCLKYFHHRRVKGVTHTCLERHVCAGVFENYIQRDFEMEEKALQDEYNSAALDDDFDIGAIGEIKQDKEKRRVIELDSEEEESVDDGGAMFRM